VATPPKNVSYIINGKHSSIGVRDGSLQPMHYTQQDGFCMHKKEYLDEAARSLKFYYSYPTSH
jgi:hypothetical protein